MKRIIPALGMIALLTLTLALRAFASLPVKAQNPRLVISATLAVTPNPQDLGTPTSQSPMQITPTNVVQIQPTQINTLPYGPQIGMGHGMMAGGSIWNDPIMAVIYGHDLTGYELSRKHIQVS